MAQRAAPQATRFQGVIVALGGSMIVRLPPEASAKLPSRGQVSVRGTLNGHSFRTVLEPDGTFGHWMKLDRKIQRDADLGTGDTATLELEPTSEWPEPTVPADLEAALDAAPQEIREIWEDITPMARWEWVRWVNATSNPDTRRRRVEVSLSKMNNGKRRPCCFNLASCTDPSLSRNGKLLGLV